MIKTLTCTDCRVEFTYDHRKGPTRQRCDTCTETQRLAVRRATSARYRERWPERNREQQNRANHKRLADPEHLRWKREDAMRRAYGMEPSDFEELLEQQDGKCAICGGPPNGPGKRLHVDHCHDSKRVRGLLCAKCNTAVGLLDDDPQRASDVETYLTKGAEYLRAQRAFLTLGAEFLPHFSAHGSYTDEQEAALDEAMERLRQAVRNQS